MERPADVQPVSRAASHRVAAVQLQLVLTLAAQRTLGVDHEVGVVERRVDVRIELSGGRLERAVVVAFQLRPHVAAEELPVVGVALLQREFRGRVLARGRRRRRRRDAVVERQRLAERPLRRVGDEVLAVRRHEEVLDHAAEIAVGAPARRPSCSAALRTRSRRAIRRCTGPSGPDRPARRRCRAATTSTACRPPAGSSPGPARSCTQNAVSSPPNARMLMSIGMFS